MIDLRSDTVTRPTEGMRAAMAAAEVGDDVYAEDPTVNALQARVAELFGHEAALFCPTGSMANQIALQLLVPPGEELLCDADAHVVTYEIGAAAAIGGISTRTWSPAGADIDPDTVAAMVRPAGFHAVPTRAIAVEQTHNRGGGGIIDLGVLKRLRGIADDNGVALHCDGARIWHAHVATGTPFSEYGALFETLSVCLSKGLGAPIGSLVVTSAENIARARVLRKRMGGGMRQVGVLAAAGLYALDNHIDRLAGDHARARRLAEALAPTGVVDAARVVTNIIPLDLSRAPLDAPVFGAAARERGILVSVLGPRNARLLTHLDADDAAIDRAAEILPGLLS
ncbi:GntG family PLP-dependent aldolase [Luedemannella flava]|uniref:GntG family PLP-dependent aldolase n=1 Tax=Luedemannella flava TaxID=349316 RepID=A0ABN2M708_9ACTN